MNKIVKQDFKDLVDDCKEIFIGGNLAMIEMQHALGKRLCEEKNITEALTHVAVELGKSERSLWYSVEFYRAYPDMGKVPGGKIITWRKIRNQLLSGKNLECEHNWKSITICSSCGKRLKLNE